MMKLYGFVRSRSNRPMWALEEIGAPYEFYQLDFQKGDPRSSYFLALNPAGKIPALVDGDLCLTESGAICNYIGEKYPDSGLTPAAGTRERAKYDQWMYFALTELEQPLWLKGKHTFGLPEKYRIPAVFETAIYEFKKAAKLLADALGDREFMIGDRLTMVDIVMGHTLKWAMAFDFPIDHENLKSYFARLEARPAYQAMKDKELLSIPRED